MTLPGAEHAIIDAPKLRDYLLSREHPVGRFKAAFFETLGYTQSGWKLLHADLLDLSRRSEATAGQPTEFGQKYEVRGTLRGPSGRLAKLVSVWVVLVGEDSPRFVTAYPE